MNARALIGALLNRDPKLRLGSSPLDGLEIKKHVYFSTVNWDALVKKQTPPPYKPLVESENDTSNFDPTFTDQDANLNTGHTPASGGKSKLDSEISAQFQGFTFNQDSEIGRASVKTGGQ